MASVKITGLSSFDATQVVSASGLHSNQSITLQDIQAAVQRLAQPGFFESVKYRYSYDSGKMDLEFQVVETKKLLPCIFNNFVWFNDNEILNAMRARMPMFSGRIPEVGTALQDVTRALQDLLRARNIAGAVTTMLYQEHQGAPLQCLFQVSGVDLPIRKLEFPGSKAVPEPELQEKAKPLLGQQYSRTLAQKFARETLAQLFRKKGYLRMRFKDVALRIEDESASATGITVILEPDEGLEYTWSNALWTGDSGLLHEDLNLIMRLKTGDIADGIQIDEGLAAIERHFGKYGYIEAQTKATPDFNDADRTVTYNIQVDAGPQYRMGSLIFKGVQEQVAKRLESLWRLRAGDIFDVSYANEFPKKDAKEEIAKIRPKQIIMTMTADREHLLENVTFEFK
ncbi:MAG: hypothetical protein LAP85_16155 [Acidobacteriia bacterium]|nr:hypothetical protein [Terriglobia bacterium]